METMASSPHRMTTGNQGVHFFSLLSRTLLMRGRQKKDQNAKDRKQAQMDRAEWPAGGAGPSARPAPPRGIGQGCRSGTRPLRLFAVLCVLCV